jgi:biotin synthase
VHRAHADPARIQCSQLLSIKTGGCPEDCGYCSQSAHHATPVQREPLMELPRCSRPRARRATAAPTASAWARLARGEGRAGIRRGARDGARVKALGLETCVTLGMLERGQAERLREAGLDYYKHNLDTGRSHYAEIVSTRTYDERLATLEAVRAAGLSVCCGGILGMGESRGPRASSWRSWRRSIRSQRACRSTRSWPSRARRSPTSPRSTGPRSCARRRGAHPHAALHGAAVGGRTSLHEAAQALCFLAGANSIFVGDELLTTPNPSPASDAALLAKLGLEAGARRALAQLRVRGSEPLADWLARERERRRRKACGASSPARGEVSADFTSNDYLGFAREGALLEGARAALEQFGAGGRPSRLLGGGSQLDRDAERACAEWLGAEDALLFASGYHANLGLVAALCGPGDAVLCDELVHASLVDAVRLSRARAVIWRHADAEDLERKLAPRTGGRAALVLTESIFSMDGDLAPLGAIADACARHGAMLAVDEAHACGLIGRAERAAGPRSVLRAPRIPCSPRASSPVARRSDPAARSWLAARACERT